MSQDVYIILLGSECPPDWLCYVRYKLEHVLFPDWDWMEPHIRNRYAVLRHGGPPSAGPEASSGGKLTASAVSS